MRLYSITHVKPEHILDKTASFRQLSILKGNNSLSFGIYKGMPSREVELFLLGVNIPASQF